MASISRYLLFSHLRIDRDTALQLAVVGVDARARCQAGRSKAVLVKGIRSFARDFLTQLAVIVTWCTRKSFQRAKKLETPPGAIKKQSYSMGATLQRSSWGSSLDVLYSIPCCISPKRCGDFS